MDEHTSIATITNEPLRGRRVFTADRVYLGPVDGDTESHIRVRTHDGDAPGGHLWLARTMIQDIGPRTIRLNRERADLHDAVLSLSPGEQREYQTLGVTTARLGRARGLGHIGR